jgi:3-oxoacyl-[acyl-carrier protein] reductase
MAEKKIALVTGASRGIGQAIARVLALAGHFVVGTATTEKGALAIKADFERAGMNGIGEVLNVTDSESITSLVDTIQQDRGPIQILVNNAGITRDNLMLRMKPESWHDVINTNLNSVFYTSQLCLRGMMKMRWGRIVNISSVVASMGNPGQANYCAAKAGMEGFTKSLALEVATRGITVNAVAPGFIDTHMTKALTDSQKDAILKMIPMNRIGRPEAIAKAVAFIVSEDAEYMTGQTLHINGGMFMS